MPDIVGSALSRCDLLFSKTDWVIADINNQLYFGPTGTPNTDPSVVTMFDFRSYRSLYVYVYLAGLTGGSTPKAGVQLVAYDQATYPGGTYWVHTAASQTVASGGSQLLFGEAGAIPATNTGVASINGSPVTYSYMPIYGQFQLTVSGSPTGLTAPGLRVFVYGKR